MNYGDTAECAVFGVLCLGQWATSASCYGAAGIVRRGAGCQVQGGVVQESAAEKGAVCSGLSYA